ncbi:zinc ABC transporter substrate-binding protein [Jatrophihabitans telluris]|uniref:Zinc ABC transporter substrate-binding protein n=1 Tax=Jatrophihabitans telluris TaxID=2038343 RepID=A0ABY4R2J0_9ACTN|nr:zinc ABC transporter substrate-binding protein [Jatrophihabitans telluris]UQX89623.1 zinc ABC transporter substrate-binding protein [Jatrophihabitans telluris]
MDTDRLPRRAGPFGPFGPFGPSGVIALVVCVVLLASGCSSSSSASTNAGKVRVVAATDVWGDIAGQIGGNRVSVTSLITSPSADPHSYEANVRNQVAMSNADVIIENGGGYDDFMETMRRSAGTSATVVNAVALSGRQSAGSAVNEHVWYDFPTVEAVASRLADELAGADPQHAATFRANAQTFTASIGTLIGRESSIKRQRGGHGIAITEPVPLYLLQACGLVNRTPDAFSHAVEEENDVAPRVLLQTLALFNQKQVSALVYNAQTTGAATERVIAAAKANNIPVVPVTETLPDGQSYLSWMSANLDALSSALSATS